MWVIANIIADSLTTHIMEPPNKGANIFIHIVERWSSPQRTETRSLKGVALYLEGPLYQRFHYKGHYQLSSGTVVHYRVSGSPQSQ